MVEVGEDFLCQVRQRRVWEQFRAFDAIEIDQRFDIRDPEFYGCRDHFLDR